MRSAVTVSLVPEARGGPFVFWDDLDAACASAAKLGFDAVEIFPPGPEIFEGDAVASALARHDLKLAAVGTGAGWVKHKLTLTSADADERKRAAAFVRSIIDAAAKFGAPAIIGSMQGRWGGDVPQGRATEYLRGALDALSLHAATRETILLYEPLNRYETNLCNTLAAGVEFFAHMPASRIQLLADLFHMNIEESNLASAIRENGSRIGHVHLADSNRRPALSGHTDFEAIAEALNDIGYAGYLSAECLPYAFPESAAETTMAAFKHFFRDPSRKSRD
jgi:sugar phosphate isomerase/epimerase